MRHGTENVFRVSQIPKVVNLGDRFEGCFFLGGEGGWGGVVFMKDREGRFAGIVSNSDQNKTPLLVDLHSEAPFWAPIQRARKM